LHERGRRESNIGAEIMIRCFRAPSGLGGGSQFVCPVSHADRSWRRDSGVRDCHTDRSNMLDKSELRFSVND
jgi:hypothetical protein